MVARQRLGQPGERLRHLESPRQRRPRQVGRHLFQHGFRLLSNVDLLPLLLRRPDLDRHPRLDHFDAPGALQRDEFPQRPGCAAAEQRRAHVSLQFRLESAGGGRNRLDASAGGGRNRLDAEDGHVGDVRLLAVIPMDVVERQDDRLPPADRGARRRQLDLDPRGPRDAGGPPAVDVARGQRLDQLPHAIRHRFRQPGRAVVEARDVGEEQRLGQQQLVVEGLDEREITEVETRHRAASGRPGNMLPLPDQRRDDSRAQWRDDHRTSRQLASFLRSTSDRQGWNGAIA